MSHPQITEEEIRQYLTEDELKEYEIGADISAKYLQNLFQGTKHILPDGFDKQVYRAEELIYLAIERRDCTDSKLWN